MEQFRSLLVGLDLGPQADALTPGSLKCDAAGRVDRAPREGVPDAASLREARRVLGCHETATLTSTDARPGGRPTAGTRRRRSPSCKVKRSTSVLVVRSESAWLAIIHEVLREGLDAVVAGKRTDVHSDGRKLGTVARKLLRKCPCAVWLEDLRHSGDPSVILAATDLTPVGNRVVELAASVAHALGAQLHVVHAYSVSMEAQLEGGEARQEYERHRKRGMALVAHLEQNLAATPMAGAAKLHVGD